MSFIVNYLTQVGLSGFGITMPRISWSLLGLNQTYDFNFDTPNLTLDASLQNSNPLAGAMWVAPLPGLVHRVMPNDATRVFPLPLIRADGSREVARGTLLTVYPQAYARLSRLYLEVYEAPPAAGARFIPMRPVPKYFFFEELQADAANNDNNRPSGSVLPCESLGAFIGMRVYDAEGMPIDPAAVLTAFARILARYPALMAMPMDGATPPLMTMHEQMLGAQANIDTTLHCTLLVRTCDLAGQPVTSLGGFTGGATNPAAGLTLEAQPTPVTLPLTAPFPLPPAVTLTAPSAGHRVGSTHRGTLGAAVALPAVVTPAAAQGQRTPPPVYRDFFTVKLLDLDPFLLGPPDPLFSRVFATNGAPVTLEQRPTVRTNETLTLLTEGNSAVQSVFATIGPAPTLPNAPNPPNAVFRHLVFAPQIDTSLAPVGAAGAPLWPAAPAPAATNPLPTSFTPPAAPSAVWINNPPPSPPDVELTVPGLPPGASVRVYPRRFLPEGRTVRGDGAGAVVPAGGAIVVRLVDPFDGNATPNALLRFDLVVVHPTAVDPDGNPWRRVYGGLQTNVGTAPPVWTPPPAIAPFINNGLELNQGGSPLLGLDPAPLPPGATPLDVLNYMFGGTEPALVSTRMPGQVDRTLIAAELSAGGFTGGALLSGGRLAPEALSAQATIGAPGSAGGREVQSVGVAVGPGPLAYDLAQHALRRVEPLANTLRSLFHADWDPPAAPAAGALNTFAAAVLQNTAPMAEQPDLWILSPTAWNGGTPTLASAYAFNHTDNWVTFFSTPGVDPGQNQIDDPLHNQIDFLTDALPQGTLNLFGFTINRSIPLASDLLAARTAIDTAGATLPAPPPPTLAARRTRVYNELHRRVSTAWFGRRDTERALRAAFARARRFIYVETPALGTTDYRDDLLNGLQPDPLAAVPADLWKSLADRMDANPELELVVCIPREPDADPRYGNHGLQERHDRQARLLDLPQDRVRVFHPFGFPGRPSGLATTTIVVDDIWALVGGSTPRLRGLRYDASTDLVLTDMAYELGRSPRIAAFRRDLLARRLAIRPRDRGLLHPDYARLLAMESAFEVVAEIVDEGGRGRVEPFTPIDPDPALTTQIVLQTNPDGDLVTSDDGLFGEQIAVELIPLL